MNLPIWLTVLGLVLLILEVFLVVKVLEQQAQLLEQKTIVGKLKRINTQLSEEGYRNNQSLDNLRNGNKSLIQDHKIVIEKAERFKLEAMYAQYLLKQLVTNWNTALVIKSEDVTNPALRLSYNKEEEKYDVRSYRYNKNVEELVTFYLAEGEINTLIADLEAEKPVPLSMLELITKYKQL